jgi:hypothetical protein
VGWERAPDARPRIDDLGPWSGSQRRVPCALPRDVEHDAILLDGPEIAEAQADELALAQAGAIMTTGGHIRVAVGGPLAAARSPRGEPGIVVVARHLGAWAKASNKAGTRRQPRRERRISRIGERR